MAMDDNTLFLPEDIVINILKRLPVKSLIRFQCVCKDWKDLLKTPSFIATHLQHSSNQSPSLLLTRFEEDNHMLFGLLDCNLQYLEVQNAPVIEWDRGRLIGSCNGLLCFFIDYSISSPPSFLLWNPATREVRLVPRPLSDFHGVFFTGFGFSPIVDDYKIVIYYVTACNFNFEIKRVEVYTLSTGLWKEIEIGSLKGASIWYQTTTTNGVIFWLGYKMELDDGGGGGGGNLIVSFDIAKEVFRVLPMPAIDPISIPSLSVYENKPAFLVLTTSQYSEYSSIDLWVLEEDIDAPREMWNWTKKYTSHTLPFSLFPETIWRSEAVSDAVSKTDGRENNDEGKSVLYLLNFTTREWKMIPMARLFHGGIVNYIESLVPLGNSHIEEL